MKAIIVGWIIAILAYVVVAEETVEDAGTIVHILYSNDEADRPPRLARIARNLVDNSVDHIATMATIFPEDHESLAGMLLNLVVVDSDDRPLRLMKILCRRATFLPTRVLRKARTLSPIEKYIKTSLMRLI